MKIFLLFCKLFDSGVDVNGQFTGRGIWFDLYVFLLRCQIDSLGNRNPQLIAQTCSILQTLPTFHNDSILILERETLQRAFSAEPDRA